MWSYQSAGTEKQNWNGKGSECKWAGHWYFTRGRLCKSLGVLESKIIDVVTKEHEEEVSAPSWFTVDIRLGSLSLSTL